MSKIDETGSADRRPGNARSSTKIEEVEELTLSQELCRFESCSELRR